MKPEVTKHGITFLPIPEFSDEGIAFGLNPDNYFDKKNLPKVPPVFENLAHKLFFEGGRLPEFPDAIDKVKSMKVVRAWLGSYTPAHEEKMATVGYALWVWSTSSDDTAEASV